MIFVTVGTLSPFDRLVRALDRAYEQNLIEEEAFAQIGTGGYKPKHFEYVEVLDKASFDTLIHHASCLISHAGMGSITAALAKSKPLLVMPRLKRFGEHVNDHQVGTAKKFEGFGHILAAYDKEELVEKIKLLKTFVPKSRVPNRQGVVERINLFLRGNSVMEI